MNRLERIVYQVKNGLMTEQQAVWSLTKDAEREDNKFIQMLPEDDYYAEDPLEQIIEEETKQEQWEVLQNVFSELTTIERQLLWYVIGEGQAIRRVAARMNMPKSTAYDVLLKAWEKIKPTNPDNITEKNCYCRGINISDLFYSRVKIKKFKPVLLGYPFELLQSVNAGGMWKNHSGRKVFASKAKCLLTQYFSAAFKDTKTICTMCGKRCEPFCK